MGRNPDGGCVWTEHERTGGKRKTKDEEKEGEMGNTGEWKNPRKTSDKVSTVKRGDGNGDTDLLWGEGRWWGWWWGGEGVQLSRNQCHELIEAPFPNPTALTF